MGVSCLMLDYSTIYSDTIYIIDISSVYAAYMFEHSEHCVGLHHAWNIQCHWTYSVVNFIIVYYIKFGF